MVFDSKDVLNELGVLTDILKHFVLHILKSVIPNIMKCVLLYRIIKMFPPE